MCLTKRVYGIRLGQKEQLRLNSMCLRDAALQVEYVVVVVEVVSLENLSDLAPKRGRQRRIATKVTQQRRQNRQLTLRIPSLFGMEFWVRGCDKSRSK